MHPTSTTLGRQGSPGSQAEKLGASEEPPGVTQAHPAGTLQGWDSKEGLLALAPVPLHHDLPPKIKMWEEEQ